MSEGRHWPRAGLTEVPTTTLTSLLDEIEHGRRPCPLTRIDLEMGGYGRHASTILTVVGALDRMSVTGMLQAIIAERTAVQGPSIDVVWTGPEGPGAGSRQTSVVVHELFSRAERSILIAGFRFDDGPSLLAPLHRAMVERAVAVTMIVDVQARPASNAADSGEYAVAQLDKFLHRNWTFGPPRPELYFDPRTASAHHAGQGVSMHAKCIVVDEKLSLVGSANFTRRAQDRNYELGLLVDDPRLAHDLIVQWRALITGGQLLRHT